MRRGIALCIAVLLLFDTVPVPAAAQKESFKDLYDYYFPKHSAYVTSFYRRGFDAVLFGSPPKAGEERHPLYRAVRGDAAAFHAFVHHPDRSAEGEFAETWHYECLFLVLVLGDERFAKLLQPEDRQTREEVGAAIDSQVVWTRHDFSRTRELYSYRYINTTHQALEEKHGGGVSKLLAILARDRRFAGVRVYSTKDGGGRIVVTASKSMSVKARSDLRDLVKQCVGKDGAVIIK